MNLMPRKLGVWIFGARGAVATCSILGAAAARRGLSPAVGMITETPLCASLDLAPISGFAFGGHDIRCGLTTLDCALEYQRATGIPPADLIENLRKDLAAVDPWVKPGTAIGCGKAILDLAEGDLLEKRLSLHGIIDRIRADMDDFEKRLGLDAVVAINLSSTEPYAEQLPSCYARLASLEKAIDDDRKSEITAGVLYAYAAVGAGRPYVNFTPSVAAEVPALVELAEKKKVPVAGKDGKTGETLVKTALAPMFVARALDVMAWEGHNIFGNRDAQVLNDPQNNLAKTKGKDHALREILGNPAHLHTRVRIDSVPSLDDWKTAWDFIHFRGFLGTKMIMQFIWQGCDSMLAAPLALDLVRLVDHAARSGCSGNQDHLAQFFKNPVGGGTNDFFKQFARLEQYAHATSVQTSRKKK
jgi:myo-inositol-1-phosphate synthase